ncbi:MAG: hypothetical protein ACXWCT_14235, partial [Flavitalea sp.]
MKTGTLLLIMILLSYPLYAVSRPATIAVVNDYLVLKEPPRPKKMKLIERIRLLRKFQKLSGKKQDSKITARQKRQARWSLILGLISFAFLFMPFAMFIAFPAAIGGLIFGIKSVDGNSNAQGIIGIVFSSIA